MVEREKTLVAKVTEKKEEKLQFFPRLIMRVVEYLFPRSERAQKLCLQFIDIISFAVVFFIGISINTIVKQSLLATLCFFFWMWLMTVGPFGYLWGFTSKPKKVKKEKKQ